MADIEEDALECPVCGGVVEETYSGALTCRTFGSAHYRLSSERRSVWMGGDDKSLRGKVEE